MRSGAFSRSVGVVAQRVHFHAQGIDNVVLACDGSALLLQKLPVCDQFLLLAAHQLQ
jgi:hypothetical protein